MCNNKRIKSQIKRFHQIDIHKDLLLHEEDNGLGKNEEEVQLNLVRKRLKVIIEREKNL